MSDAKFTKGPWAVKSIEDDREYIRVRGTRLGLKFKIANVLDLKNHHDNSKWCERDRAESLANAHLIAAAPEMYELLDDAWRVIYELIDEVNDQRISRVHSQTETPPDLYDMEPIHLIQSLLAKARGDQ